MLISALEQTSAIIQSDGGAVKQYDCASTAELAHPQKTGLVSQSFMYEHPADQNNIKPGASACPYMQPTF